MHSIQILITLTEFRDTDAFVNVETRHVSKIVLQQFTESSPRESLWSQDETITALTGIHYKYSNYSVTKQCDKRSHSISI